MTKIVSKNGMTFVETIIAAALSLTVVVGSYQAYEAVYAAVSAARLKALAADLANTRFEIIKNLPYSDVGTIGGIPPGIIPSVEVVNTGDVSFSVSTTIENVDDPFDGTAGTGDLIPNDYKRIELEISCSSCKYFKPVKINGILAPKNLEVP